MKAELKMSSVPVIAGLARKLPHVTRRIVFVTANRGNMIQG